MNSKQLEQLFRSGKAGDPALFKRKTRKGAKHAVNPVWLPTSKQRPALYRQRHRGKRKRGGR